MLTLKRFPAFVSSVVLSFLSLAVQAVPSPDTLRYSIKAPPVGVQADVQFGTGVAAEGSFVAVGAPADRDSANVGSVKIFDSSSGALLHVLRNPRPGGASFGQSVAISGTRVVVGAYRDDTEATNAGRAYVYDLSSETPTVPVATLRNPDPTAEDEFGFSVSISGTRVAVGGRFGGPNALIARSVYVFDLSTETPTTPVVTLNNPSSALDDFFGIAVAVSGTRIVVGAHFDDTGANNAGRVYVYDMAGATPTVPALMINNPAPGQKFGFGLSVAISGTDVVVGSSSETAYVYDLASGTPTVPVRTLNNPEPESGDAFGYSVAISGSRILVGTPRDDLGTNAGSAYVFDLASGTPTVPAATLNNPAPGSFGDEFGNAVAISGTKVVVGAHFDNNGTNHTGNAYLYELAGSSPSAPVATLGTPSPSAGDSFGYCVAASGTYVVVGAIGDPNPSALGSVYVYDLGSGSPTVPILTIDDPNPSSYSGFGRSVAISGSRIVVGTAANRVYVYDLASASPAIPLVTFSGPSSLTDFGCSVAISGTRVVVGNFDTGDSDIGQAFVYDLETSTPEVPVLVLNNPEPAQDDFFGADFGRVVAISGQRVIVAAEGDDVALTGGGEATDGGSVYVYDLGTASPNVPVITLRSPAPEDFDYFGHSIAISGTKIAVGAYQDNAGASDSGSAYVYDLSSPTPTTPVATLGNPVPAARQGFGQSIAISGNVVMVGTRGVDSGSAYVFDLSGSSPEMPVATLNNPSGISQELFGSSVALSGSTAIIGVPQSDSPQVDKGSIYVFVPDETITRAPVLTAPASGTLTRSPISVSFELPEAALPGSLTLSFTGTTTHTLTLASSQETSGLHGFIFDPKNPTQSSPQIASGDAIPDGTYTATISYRDALGNPAATASSANVTIDATAPVLSGQFSPFMVTVGALPNYLPQLVVTDASEIVELTQEPPAGSPTTPGIVGVILRARDAAGNESSTGLGIVIRPSTPLTSAILAQGDSAPGAGTAGGPPADAKLASFGVPAIDRDQHVAFTAAWTSNEGKGAGIFKDNECIATVGGAVPELSEATFKTISDPLIEDGKVAFLATLAGVAKNQNRAVVSNATGALKVIAHTGQEAPGTDGATFKTFKAMALAGDCVALHAQLGGSASSAKDIGVWAKRGSDPLVLILREGQEIAPGKIIKKLTAFVGGNGSPGQGRGWLHLQEGLPQVSALAAFTDKSQAVIEVSLNDLEHPVLVSQGGAVGVSGSPLLENASFASYSVPMAIDGNPAAFLGTLTVGAGEVTKANSRGIFADPSRSGRYEAVVRVGDSIDDQGTVFGTLKDPVVALTSAIAFPASLKGATVKGPAAQSLWWRPVNGTLTLVAQGGEGAVSVAGIVGAQWKSFPSLAIASRGPIFTGTLVPGKGGVTKATANGVWATDFEGNLRLLIQSGVTQIDGKTVKSFTLLNATSGSEGSTRSFNADSQIVWRATFDDKSQAIIKTEVP